MKDYRSTHMVDYEQPWTKSFATIQCLHFLNGKPWDEIALSYVHALRPSSIRVTTGACTLDARLWRVTVVLDNRELIQYISQEVEVGIYPPIVTGHHLGVAINFGLGSKEELFYRQDEKNPIVSLAYGRNNVQKTLQDGTNVLMHPEKPSLEEEIVHLAGPAQEKVLTQMMHEEDESFMRIRMHRGGLAESMLTVEQIATTKEAVVDYLRRRGHLGNVTIDDVGVEPYIDVPDDRLRWAKTFLVTFRRHAVAYCNKQLKDDSSVG